MSEIIKGGVGHWFPPFLLNPNKIKKASVATVCLLTLTRKIQQNIPSSGLPNVKL